MLHSEYLRTVYKKATQAGCINRRYLLPILGIFLLLSLVCAEFTPMYAPRVDAQSHTSSSVAYDCGTVSFSPDGNPFPICPGPYPVGGNCVWWGWEMWHLLGYDLPVNWGNAADWVVDAERSGLPLGTTPRVGSIAVFPVADGVWAYGEPGHVSFVTAVSSDGRSFDVTYQNYGDSTRMYIGTGYNVDVINQPRFQHGQLRFIYFPQTINLQRFARLPGIGSNGAMAGVDEANNQLSSSAKTGVVSKGANSSSTFTNSRVTLGIQTVSSDQEFNADFTGTGVSDLLLYNRQQGQLTVMRLDHSSKTSSSYGGRHSVVQSTDTSDDPGLSDQVVSLSDSTTPDGKWGSSLDIHVGDFSGTGHAEILLYDRVAGTMQLISLTPELTIKQHVTLSNWGSDWEITTGRFDGQRTGLFMYKRFALVMPSSGPISTSADNSNTSGGDTSSGDTSGGNLSTPTDTPSPTVKLAPTVKPSPTPTATPKPSPTITPTPTATPKPSPTAVPTPTATVKPSPTATPTPTATPKPSPTTTPTPTATPKPSPTAIPTPSPTATVKSAVPVTPTPTATPTSTATATPTPSPTAARTPTSTATLGSTAISESGATVKSGRSLLFSSAAQTRVANAAFIIPSPSATTQPGKGDLSGSELQDWERQGRSANVVVLDFNTDFSIHSQQQYTLWHANWEVYTGRFASSNQDGIFLYDRLVGEGRIMDFDSKLLINDYQEIHNLDGNWMVHSGNFNGSERSQLFMYDPGSGDAQILTFDSHLALSTQKKYEKLGANMVPYIGHFGTPSVGVMLYDAQAGQSTFVAFDSSLAISNKISVNSWDQRWQILVGAFVDHSRCIRVGNCSTGDDILVLNRETGQIEQYVFSFGRKFRVYDNRSQAFARNGTAGNSHLNAVDTTIFTLLSSVSTSIKNEELY